MRTQQYKTYVKYLNCKLYYKRAAFEIIVKNGKEFITGCKGWHESVETCSSVKICEIIVHLLVIEQNNKRYTIKLKKYLSKLARYWLKAPWRWQDSVEICSSLINGEIIVHLLVKVQNNKRWTVKVLKYLCNFARYWLLAVWGWYDNVEKCRSVIICEIIVHLMVIVQNNKRRTVQVTKYWFNMPRYWLLTVRGWHDSVETCSSVLICEIIVHLLDIVQISKRCTVQVLKYCCKLARYWQQAVWEWHDKDETWSSVIICEIIVNLLVIVQNNKRRTAHVLKYWCNMARYRLQAVWGWHDSVETCSSVIIYEIIVHLLVLVQNKKDARYRYWNTCITWQDIDYKIYEDDMNVSKHVAVW